MRYFPGAARRRVLATAVVSTLAVGAMALPIAYAADSDDLEQKQKDVRNQIAQANDELEHSSKEVRAAAAAVEKARVRLERAKASLAETEAQLVKARAKDAEMQQKLTEAEARLEQAQAELAQGRAELAAQREVVVDTVTDQYTQGPSQLIAFSTLLESSSPEELSRRLGLNQAVVDRESISFAGLTEIEAQLEEQKAAVARTKREIELRRREAAQNLEVIAGLFEEARAAKASVRTLVDSSKAAEAKARQARAADEALLAKLKREEEKIKQQIMAAAAQDDSPGYTGNSDGLLLDPVTGSVTSPFGYRKHPIYGYWGLHDGTDFGAGCGSPLRAVADGTVVSSYYSSVYGNRLYVNVGRVNGHVITAVYNHATSYRVGEGARVKRGQTVGYVGSTGWSTGCHLHFTILRDGNAVDPMGYL
ncbi:murein hydrolase activator EnvC [Nocardioides sp. SYSU D00038]|uniref:murein hydrolase activator EnvC family protein n=1 Tax=Nocardioides sp. SYSU D00038 TaxID=2812554 RepID=UPI0019683E48|nr:M23 family metallopeptidase [Nocardioides sp. SYSU D00038]